MSQLSLLTGMLLIGFTAPAGQAETPLLIFTLALAGLVPALLRKPD